ncbi:MAG: adenosylcobinamide-GDP ribazoletransferase [Haloarculaceae archaeon]
MVLTALRGALGFLSRVPVGRDERAWEAFRRTPAALVLAGYPLGALIAVPVALALALGLPGPTVAVVLPVAVVFVAGVNHADGLADLGDAAVVHGDPERRREVMGDTEIGVGAVLAVGVVLLALALAGLALAAVPVLVAAALVVTAEVGAKLAVAVLVCLGEASHDGLGAQLAREARPRRLVAPFALALPVVALTALAPTPPTPTATGALTGTAAIVAALVTALAVGRWANARLSGVSGDVFGAANELARVAALHAGVIAWTLS